MDAKEAALVALDRAREGFGHDNITNLGLEELEHEESSDSWFITVGFSRPWDFEQDPLSGFAPRKAPRRDYKVVHLSASGELLSIKNRIVENE